jgi:restriction system protein
MPEYYLKRAGEPEKGPFSASQLKAIVGNTDPDSCYVRLADKDTWYPARSVKGLFSQRPAVHTEASQANRPGAAHDRPHSPTLAFLPPPLFARAEALQGRLEIRLSSDYTDIVEIGEVWQAKSPFEELEAAIESAVQGRPDEFVYQEDWRTPSGKVRSRPVYIATVRNEYLNKVREIKKSSLEELESLAREQVEKWKSQEVRQRIAQAQKAIVSSAEAGAARLAEAAKGQINAIRNVLAQGVSILPKLNWSDYTDRREFPPFSFESTPAKPIFPSEPRRPQRGIIDQLLPFLWEKRRAKYEQQLSRWRDTCHRIDEDWKQATVDWQQRRAFAEKQYQQAKESFAVEQAKRNQAVHLFASALQRGGADAIVRYLEEVFAIRPFPWGFPVSHRVSFEEASATAVVDLELPVQERMTAVCDYKFTSTSLEATPVFMKPTDHAQMYDSAVKQAVLRTLWEVFSAVASEKVQGVVVNGWVTFLDPATGTEKTSCIISVSGSREQITKIDFRRVDPIECVKSLKGLIAGPMSQIAPVQPILHLNREDSRFIESREVLAELNATTNLAEIGWEEFEHLVRELFAKMFSKDGAEVKVTQSSRDGGVDAVAFDPDPIRGGKFVIQAKRYTRVVPVSAVRDLYGTMISEGASKGILVTTAHFGRDAREFVKDKPISLIDGANLVYLLEQHGHKVRIDVKAARENISREPLAR